MEVQICDVPGPGFDALQCDIKKKKIQKKKKSIYIWEIEKCLLSPVFLRWKQETHCVVQVLNSQKSLHFNASSIDIIDVVQRACPLFLYLLTFFFL